MTRVNASPLAGMYLRPSLAELLDMRRDLTMTDRVETDLKTLREEFADLKEDIKNITSTLQNLVQHTKAEAASKVRDAADSLPKDIKRLAQSASEHIEEKPVSAAVTSFGIGLILGMLFSGRRS